MLSVQSLRFRPALACEGWNTSNINEKHWLNSFGECPVTHNVCNEANFSNQHYLQKSLVRLWKNADSSRLLASHNSGMLNTNAECCNELHTIWRTHEGHLSDMSFKSLTSKNQIVWVIVKTKFNMKLWVKQTSWTSQSDSLSFSSKVQAKPLASQMGWTNPSPHNWFHKM